MASARVKPWISFIFSAMADALFTWGPPAPPKPDIFRNWVASGWELSAVVVHMSVFTFSPIVIVYCWAS